MSNKLKDKIEELDKVIYKVSNVDEMRRTVFISKSTKVNKKELDKIFSFIIKKILLIKNLDDVFKGYVSDKNIIFLIEDYLPNKKICIAYLQGNTIYRSEYQFTQFLGISKMKYTILIKRQTRIFGTKDWIARFYWKRNARRKAKLFIKEIKRFKN